MFGKSSSAADKLATALEAYRRDFEMELKSGAANLEADRAKEAERAKELVQQANELIRQSGLGNALIKLMEDVKYWSTWRQRGDFQKYVKFPATDILAEEEQNKESRTVTTVYFVYKNKRYGLLMTDEGHSWDGDSKVANVDFIADDAVVLSLRVGQDNDGLSEWRLVDVNALTIGPWTKDLLEIAAYIKVGNENSMRHFNEELAIDKAKKISL
jgi:hypothetical protein